MELLFKTECDNLILYNSDKLIFKADNKFLDMSGKEVLAEGIENHVDLEKERYYEKDARGGTRYIEKIKSHFGVTSPDARLQRPEYLGGHSDRININPVVQTSSTDSTSPQGNLSAFGVSGARYHGFSKSFVEHGYIIGLANVRADLTYQQGLNRMWSRKTVLDFYMR